MSLPTATAMASEVITIVQDGAFDAFAEILPFLNYGLKEVADRMLLPQLETIGTAYAGTASLTAITISFTNSTSTISDSGSALITSGLHVGETITITGADESGNNQTTTIISMASGGGSMVVAGTLTDESAGESVTVANTPLNNLPLPSDFHKDLRYVYSTTHNCKIKVYDSLPLLLREFTYIDQSGRIYGVALKGNKMYFQRIPASVEALTYQYFKHPTDLVETTDTPDDFEGRCEHFARRLLVSYAAKEIYTLIEDGIEGQKANTLHYTQMFEKHLADLRAFIGDEASEPVEVNDDMRWGAYSL